MLVRTVLSCRFGQCRASPTGALHPIRQARMSARELSPCKQRLCFPTATCYSLYQKSRCKSVRRFLHLNHNNFVIVIILHFFSFAKRNFSNLKYCGGKRKFPYSFARVRKPSDKAAVRASMSSSVVKREKLTRRAEEMRSLGSDMASSTWLGFALPQAEPEDT